jgi:hypothetical protein
MMGLVVLEVFTVVVLVRVLAALKIGMTGGGGSRLVGLEEMERFVLSGVRVVRFLQMQLK